LSLSCEKINSIYELTAQTMFCSGKYGIIAVLPILRVAYILHIS